MYEIIYIQELSAEYEFANLWYYHGIILMTLCCVYVQILSSCSLRLSPSGSLRLIHRSYAGGINEEFLTTKPGLKAKVLDGKRLSAQIQKEVRESVDQMTKVGKR